MSGREGRRACRDGTVAGSTAGIADGYVQGNLVVLRARLADDFRLFAERNPKACPVIGESRPGSREIPELGLDLDLATDVPRYRVWRDGAIVEERSAVADLWRDDLVAFVIGCSFSFEAALVEAGLPLRHVETGVRVPMYRTSIPCVPAGPFSGPMVVSMRPLTPAQAIRAVEITGRYPAVHGAPVHLARPDLIGVADLAAPDYGDPVPIGPDEIPVFWACGVTPPIGHRGGPAGLRDHARARLHAHHRPAQRRLRGGVNPASPPRHTLTHPSETIPCHVVVRFWPVAR